MFSFTLDQLRKIARTAEYYCSHHTGINKLIPIKSWGGEHEGHPCFRFTKMKQKMRHIMMKYIFQKLINWCFFHFFKKINE
jgi:hypothetical protein